LKIRKNDMSNHNEKMAELLKNGIPSLLKEKLGVVTMNNMFVGEDHLCIQQHTMLNTSLVAFSEEILKQAGYSLTSEDGQRKTFRCELPVFGSCTVTVHDSGISGKNLVGLVVVKTIWKINEAKMLKMLEYMKQTIGKEPHYDDHGYGVSPRPHEIDLRWDLPQGRIGMTWDGFNYTYGTESNHPKGDGTDFVFITLRDRDFLQAVEDKESYGYFHYEDID
jgi:hypothetical protein